MPSTLHDPKPSLGGTATAPRKPTPRTKHRRSQNGRAHSHVPASSWNKPSKKGGPKNTSLPPLKYDVGPFNVKIENYAWQATLIRGDVGDEVTMTEIENLTWDDSSAVWTGSMTVRTPDWAERYGVKGGHEVRLGCSDDGGLNWTPLWTMRVVQPNRDFQGQERTFNLVNDFVRLQESDDNFVFAKGKGKSKGWRADEVIRYILTKYGFVIAQLPVMRTYITNWHLTDQAPLDVIHSALLREKHNTGRKYAIYLDARKRVHIHAFRRPTNLLQLGPTLLAATLSTDLPPRFATALTVRAEGKTVTRKDKKGHKKQTVEKIASSVETATGKKLYGYLHRNVYSPDAESLADARKEGKQFLAAIAKPNRQFTVTMPGMPFLRRLDAIRFRLPQEDLSQVVYVTDARHNVDGESGYTTEATLTFDDPFVDRKLNAILAKLSDAAIARNRKPAAKTTKRKPKPATAAAHAVKPTTAKPGLGGTPTSPRKPGVRTNPRTRR